MVFQPSQAYANLIWTTLDYRQYEKAERYIEEGLEYASRRELAGSLSYLTAERARMGFERGRWKQAESDARWVLCRPEESGITTLPALVALARVLVRRGDPEGERTLEEAWGLAQSTGELQRIAPVAAAMAESAWLRDDLQGIEAAIDDAYRRGQEAKQPWITDELAFWMWRAGGATEALVGP